MQVFDWDKDEAHRFLGEAWIPLEDLAYAEVRPTPYTGVPGS